MPQPPAYNRRKNFTEDIGSETDHSTLNAELDNAANSINDIRYNLAIIQDDQGRIRAGAITYDSLNPQIANDLSRAALAQVQDDLDGAATNAQAAADSSITSAASASSAEASAGAASTSANRSESSAEEAYGWANTPEDVVVASLAHPNEYSAYHHAKKAERSEAAQGESHRGTFYNALVSSATMWKITSAAIAEPGSGYSVGNVCAVLVSGAEYPAWVIVREVDETGAVLALEDLSLSETGIFPSDPGEAVYDTDSDGGTGLTLNVSFSSSPASTLKDIIEPRLNQTALVLHNERMSDTVWEFIYADRNGDGIPNWIEFQPLGTASEISVAPDGQYLMQTGGILTLTDNAKRQLNSIGKVIGEIFTYAGNDTPPGAIELSVGQATAIPVTAVYNALVTKCWCGEANNNDADFFYRCSNQDGTGRSVTGAFFILPDMARRFMRGRYVGQDLQNFKYQDWAIENITGNVSSNTHRGVYDPNVGNGAIKASGSNATAWAAIETPYSPLAALTLSFDASRVVKTDTETRPMNAPFGIFIQAYLPAVYEEDRVTVDDLVAQMDGLTTQVSDMVAQMTALASRTPAPNAANAVSLPDLPHLGTYTAPANGWVVIRRARTSAGLSSMDLYSSSGLYVTTHSHNGMSSMLSACLPVKKGDVVTVEYSGASSVYFVSLFIPSELS